MVIDHNLSPSDAAVALRSLGRRYRAVFFGEECDQQAGEALAHRVGPGGWSALAHVVAATRDIATFAAGIDRILTSADPVLDRAAVDPNRRPADPQPTGTVHERISELAWEADALAERIERTDGGQWAASAVVQGEGRAVLAIDLVRAAVSAGVEHLRGAQAVLDAVRAQEQP